MSVRLDHVWATVLNSVSETRDQFGRRVVTLKLGKWDPDVIPVEEWFASTFVMLEVLTKVEAVKVKFCLNIFRAVASLVLAPFTHSFTHLLTHLLTRM